MCKDHTNPEALLTIWQVPDELWGRIAPLLAELDPTLVPRGANASMPVRPLDAIIFRLRSGCQWNQLPLFISQGTCDLADTPGASCAIAIGQARP